MRGTYGSSAYPPRKTFNEPSQGGKSSFYGNAFDSVANGAGSYRSKDLDRQRMNNYKRPYDQTTGFQQANSYKSRTSDVMSRWASNKFGTKEKKLRRNDRDSRKKRRNDTDS